MKLTLIGLIAALVAGCTTSPVPESQATPVSALVATSGESDVVIVRDSGLYGGLYDARIFMDGRKVALLATSEKVDLRVAPGEHIVALQMIGEDAPSSAIEFIAKPGATRHYRVLIENARLALIPVRQIE